MVAIGVLSIPRCSNGSFWLFRALLCNEELEYGKRETRTILRLAEASWGWGCEVAVVLEAKCCGLKLSVSAGVMRCLNISEEATS